MWQTIGNIFLNYWVEFALAGFVTVVGFFIKKYLKLNNEALERNQKEYHDKIQTDIIDKNQEMINQVIENSKADDRALQREIDLISKEMSALKGGLLSVQGRNFKSQCRHLLEEDHGITLDEWEEIDADHEAYNSLGGNHKGDELFELVKQKAANHITK